MIVQYLSEYITAMNGDGQKIAAFEERYGYTPKPHLRDGIKDSRYYQLSNYHPNEHSRRDAAVRLFAVVVHEPKVAPPRGKQREVIRQWLIWLSRRQAYLSVEELVNLCKRETGIGNAETINSIVNQTSELNNWRNAPSVVTETQRIFETVTSADAVDAAKVTDDELLNILKNDETYRAANAKDRRTMKKAFAKMSHEERALYFALD